MQRAKPASDNCGRYPPAISTPFLPPSFLAAFRSTIFLLFEKRKRRDRCCGVKERSMRNPAHMTPSREPPPRLPCNRSSGLSLTPWRRAAFVHNNALFYFCLSLCFMLKTNRCQLAERKAETAHTSALIGQWTIPLMSWHCCKTGALVLGTTTLCRLHTAWFRASDPGVRAAIGQGLSLKAASRTCTA